MFQTYTYKLQILEHHLDTFGHVNNATYLEIYEEARWDFITKNGYGLKEIVASQKGPIILEFNCKYKRELKLREWVTVTFQVTDDSSKVMKARHEIIKEDGTVASEAELMVGFFDLKERKLIKPTPEWRKAVGDKNFT